MRYETIYEKVHTAENGFKWITLKSGRRVMFRHGDGTVVRHLLHLSRVLPRRVLGTVLPGTRSPRRLLATKEYLSTG